MPRTFRRSRLVILVSCIFTGLVPALAGVLILLDLKSDLTWIRHEATLVRNVQDAVDKVGGIMFRFGAVSLDGLSEQERVSLRDRGDIELKQMRASMQRVIPALDGRITPAEHAGILGAIATLNHSWDELHQEVGRTMTAPEKAYHFLRIMEAIESLRDVLGRLSSGSFDAIGRETRQSMSHIEVTIGATLVLLGIVVLACAVSFNAANRHVAALNEAVARRDAALDELRRANDASSAKSRFLATVSHEIRTPMNGVLGMAELLLTTELTERQRRVAATIHESGRFLLAIIDGILDLSRIETGKLALKHQDFVPERLVEEVLYLFSERAAAKGLRMEMDLAPDLPAMVAGDPGRLRQVLSNLVGNAVKYTRQGAIDVLVRVERTEPDGATLCRFEVRDTGIGISATALPHVFDAFVQDNADRDGPETASGTGTGTDTKIGTGTGTGLGLAICKDLVGLMGGEIGVESRLGQGATFWFTARFAAAQAPARPENDDPALSGMRLLVVDAGPGVAEHVADWTRAWGMQVEAVTGGDEATTLLRAGQLNGQPFDIVLIDVRLPEFVRLTGRITSDPLLSATRCVLMGPGDASVAKRSGTGTEAKGSDETGIDTWLRVPLRRADLHEALRAAVRPMPLPVPGPGQSSEPATSMSHLRVLVAEDNPVNQEVARLAFEHFGVDVEIAEDGNQALAAWRARRHDVVFMDCRMPNLDGFTATRAIRAEEARDGLPRTPVIAMTANAFPDDREECLRAGMDDHLSKPFQLEDLRELLLHLRAVAPPEAGADTGLHPAALDNVRALQRAHAPDMLRNVASLFMMTTPGYIAAMHRAAASDQVEVIASLAHALRASSASLGAVELSRMCQRLDQNIHVHLRRGELGGDYSREVLEIEVEFDRITPALASLIEQEAA